MYSKFITIMALFCCVPTASAAVVEIDCNDKRVSASMKTMAGKVYQQGLEVPLNVDEARKCFIQAASAKDPEAIYHLVNMHVAGSMTGMEDLLTISEVLGVDVSGADEAALMLKLLALSHDLGYEPAYYLHEQLKYGPVHRK